MSKTIKEVLQLHWMDGAKLSGGSYHGEPSLNAEEAMDEIARLLEQAKPKRVFSGDIKGVKLENLYSLAVDDYRQNIKKILGE